MKKIIVFMLIALGGLVNLAMAQGNLIVKAKYDGQQVKLRWLMKDKALDYQYRLYRAPIISPEKKRQLGSFSMAGYEEAKKVISKDNQFALKLMYPFKTAASRAELNASLSQTENRLNLLLMLSMFKPEVAQLLGQRYYDTNITPKSAYLYTVEAYKKNRLIDTAKVAVVTKNTAVLPMPWGVVANQFPWGVGLKWQGYEPYIAFNIYRSNSFAGTYTKINKTPVQVQTVVNADGTVDVPPYFYSDTTISKGKTYFYQVRGIDFFADLGPVSDIAVGKIKIDQRPAPPRRPTLAPHETGIDIKWQKSADKGVIGYNVYRAFAQSGPFQKINRQLIQGTSLTDHDIVVDTNYFYIITAVNKGGFESMKSLASMAVAKDATPPPVVTGLIGKLQKATVHLQWQGVKAADLLGYRIYRTLQPQGLDWALLNQKPQSELSFIDALQENLSRYPFYYRITSVDRHFNESAPSKEIKIQLPDVTPPRTPSITASSVRNGQVALTWDAITAYDLAGYRVYRIAHAHKTKITKKILRQPSYVDASPPLGQSIKYEVVAVDKTGNESIPSSPFTLMVRDESAPVITSFKAVKVSDGVKLTVSVKDNDPAGFDVFRSRNNRDFVKINPARLQGREFIDHRITKGRRYFYKVVFWDKAANSTNSMVRELKIR